ncbi:MAG: carbamoyltransferase HypF [Bacillota bacterium]|nr:carbamoyltransferase HypF [Bacillota bacterium]
MKRYAIKVHGIVQGVGFRPFVYGQAQRAALSGWVLNDANGVSIEIEGAPAACDAFIAALREHPPALSRVDEVIVAERPPLGEQGFEIRHSRAGLKSTLISPDMGTCDDCLADIRDPANRRYRYPFANCTNCGPRFTIIRDLPYDRGLTTMSGFVMCEACNREFIDPLDRRFHAQPIACAECGPRLRFTDARGAEISGEPLDLAALALSEGKLLALKGLGGFHLLCDAQNADAVQTLRQRKYRYDKPFALMLADSDTARRFCDISAKEQALLESRRRPIVLLKKKAGGDYLAPQIAPGNGRLGVMLPYTPLHYLLSERRPALVATSGNISDEPIVYEDERVYEVLGAIADFVLTHDRGIFRRIDDSVLIHAAGAPRLIRRARGYVPESRHLRRCRANILALGGEQKNTFTLTRGEQAFISQHIGDLDNIATLESLRREIGYYISMFEAEPEIIAHDLHPRYLSTQLAAEFDGGLPRVAVQHHHAHLASVMAEHGLTGELLGLIYDGSGYGEDGCLWGGELLLGDLGGYQRRAHLLYLPLPGGEAAIRAPWRAAMSALHAAMPQAAEQFSWPEADWPLLLQAARRGVNAPLSSGMGRLFDAAAVLAGGRGYVNYEGQAAVEFEQAIDDSCDGVYQCALAGDIIDWRPMVAELWRDRQRGASRGRMAARFHRGLVEMSLRLCLRQREQSGVNDVALSGGCWMNVYLLEHTMAALREQGFNVYANSAVPANDGGLSFGQAAVAAAKTTAR